jgi:hypothetical protein
VLYVRELEDALPMLEVAVHVAVPVPPAERVLVPCTVVVPERIVKVAVQLVIVLPLIWIVPNSWNVPGYGPVAVP